jgi:conjugative relaxase-like TrwC/TraI family protein
VICSVTTLGARGRTTGAVAADVVSYLEGRRAERGGSRPGVSIELPSPAGGVVAYYADAAGEGPGTWFGTGAQRLGLLGDVEGTDLWWVLQGKDPRTHETLLGAQGSAGRANRARRELDDREWWTLKDAGEVLGVSPSYLRRLAERTQRDAAQRAFELMAGAPLSEPSPTWLVAEKDGGSWRVSGTELRNFMALRKPPTVVVGHDVTFSVEKSVSALWARADDATRVEILAAVDASVAAGMDYLERNAARVRVRGTREEAQGLVAASYLHSTSRALDPQLHRHVVVANFATGPDGVVRTLDSTSLYHHAKTAGYMAGAELRHQLTARLGLQWTPVRNGLAEVAGVPETAIEAISTRRKEIDAAARALAEEGAIVDAASLGVRQTLALATRAPKEGGVDPEELRSVWTRTLTEAGLDSQVLRSVLHRTLGPEVVTEGERAELFVMLGGPSGVTERHATFDRRDVLQAITSWSVGRLSAQACERLADEWLVSHQVMPLHPAEHHASSRDRIHRHDGTIVTAGSEQRYTTREMLEVEARIEHRYRRGRDVGRAVVPPAITEAVLARPAFAHLSGEQQALVRHITGSGDETGLVKGPAGTGKTTALEAAARAWEEAGYRVLGASVNGNAAEHLGRATGIEATTVASLLWRLADYNNDLVDQKTVVVLDEATTLANRDLDALLGELGARGAALRLVGDPAQHTAVGAGGAFRWLVETHPEDVAELTVNRRQVGDDMAQVRLALGEYREGAITAAIERLERDQRIVTAESAGELLDTMTADWYVDRQRAAADPTFSQSSMTAAHHDERRALVARARALLRADGTIHGPELVVAGMAFQAGDEVIAKVPDRSLCPKDDRSAFVKNGTRGAVVSVGQNHLVVDFEHRGEITVPLSYLEQEVAPGVRGGLLHSYCLTTYAAQGDTYGAARHLGTDHSSRAELYVGLTRGRHDVTLYAVGREQFVGQVVDDDMPRLNVETDAARAMAASAAAGGAERLAREVDPTVGQALSLADRCTLAELKAGVETAGTDHPLYARAFEIATERIGAQAIAEPSSSILRELGPRPHELEERDLWDTAVREVAVYQSLYATHPFPLGATNELIGLKARSPDPEAWDAVDRAVKRHVEMIVDRSPTPSHHLEVEPLPEL